MLDSIGDLIKIDYWDNNDFDDYLFDLKLKDYYNDTNSNEQKEYFEKQTEINDDEENNEQNIFKINKNNYIKNILLYFIIIFIVISVSYYINKKIKLCNKNNSKNGMYDIFKNERELEIKY